MDHSKFPLPLDDKVGSEQYVWTVLLLVLITIVITGVLLLRVLGVNHWLGALSSPSQSSCLAFNDFQINLSVRWLLFKQPANDWTSPGGFQDGVFPVEI